MLINAIIVEDHALFAEGLIALLEKSEDLNIRIHGVFTDPEQVTDILERKSIQLVFLDLNLGKVNGLDLIDPIKLLSPDTRILIVSGYDNQKFVKRAFIDGADGYILKGSTLAELVEGIETVLANNTFMGKGVQVTAPYREANTSSSKARRSQYMDAYSVKQQLTKREQEILQLITQAFSNKEIAQKLFISDQTVSVHRKNIMRKLGVSNTVSLVKAAQRLSISES